MTLSRRAILAAAALGMAAAVLTAVLVLVFAAGGAPRPRLLVGSASASPTNLASTVAAGSAPSTGSIPVQDARAVVVRYLDDVNTQNRSDAASLICTRLQATWQNTVDTPGGDFTVAIVRAVFRGIGAVPGGVALSYALDVRPRQGTDVTTNTVTFTVTGSPGAYQLCGEG